MGKFKKVGLAIILASGMAFAQSPWWTANAPHGQVAFPWVVNCKDDTNVFDDQNPDNDCFKKMGGWWFGYIAGPAITTGNSNGCRVDMAGKTPGQSNSDNYVKAKINGSMVSFVGPDSPDCQGPDVTNRANGDSYLDGALEVELAVGTGIVGPPSWEPSIAALSTNFSTPAGGDKGNTPPVFVERDMSQYGGFCLKYESNHLPTDDFTLILGWDETDAENSPGRNFYDPYYAAIPAGDGVKTVDFAWSTTCTGTEPKVCGDFEQEGWSKTDASPITKAITKMMSVKINLKSYEPATVKFKLYAFGPKGTCNAATPIVSGKNAPSLNLTLNGRMLSINKSAMVQVYNLQGAIVQSQTLTPDSKMNLGNLPTGIYMVRAPSLGYTSRIAIK